MYHTPKKKVKFKITSSRFLFKTKLYKKRQIRSSKYRFLMYNRGIMCVLSFRCNSKPALFIYKRTENNYCNKVCCIVTLLINKAK